MHHPFFDDKHMSVGLFTAAFAGTSALEIGSGGHWAQKQMMINIERRIGLVNPPIILMIVGVLGDIRLSFLKKL